MKKIAATALVVAAAPAPAAEAHVPGCKTKRCDRRIGARWAEKHLPKYRVQSTAYSPCSSGTTMADGTRVRWGSVASNRWPLGTRIRLKHPVHGRRDFTVRDTGGMAYSVIDIFMPGCRDAVVYGRRWVTYVVLG